MISHHHKAVFVHLPKNAGQSVEHVFLNLLDLTWETRAPLLLRRNDQPELGPPRLAHLKAHEYVKCKYMTQEMFDTYFKFAVVRNPWSRTVSMYKYLGYSHKCDFKTFITGVFKDSIFIEKHWFVGPQSDYVYADDELLVDLIIRFEELQKGFDQVCKKIQLPETKLPHVNESKKTKPAFNPRPAELLKNTYYQIKQKSIPRYKQYRDYYDQECIDLVGQLYQSDIIHFNYTW